MSRFLRDIKNYFMFQLLDEKMGYRLSVVNSRKRLLRGKSADGKTVYLSKIVYFYSQEIFTIFDADMNVLHQTEVCAETYEEDMARWTKRLEYGILLFKRYLFDTKEFYAWKFEETEFHYSLLWIFGEGYAEFRKLAGDDIDILCSSDKAFKLAYPEYE